MARSKIHAEVYRQILLANQCPNTEFGLPLILIACLRMEGRIVGYSNMRTVPGWVIKVALKSEPQLLSSSVAKAVQRRDCETQVDGAQMSLRLRRQVFGRSFCKVLLQDISYLPDKHFVALLSLMVWSGNFASQPHESKSRSIPGYSRDVPGKKYPKEPSGLGTHVTVFAALVR